MKDEKVEMSDHKLPEPGARRPDAEGDVNNSRRQFTRIGVGAPVLLSLASQPVFGANCLSNALSGNLSDPDRGNCTMGAPVSTIQAAMPNWGGMYRPDDRLKNTPLAEMTHIFPLDRQNKKLSWFIEKGDRLQQLTVAALINSSTSPTYVMRQEQLLAVLRGGAPLAFGELNTGSNTLPVPYGMSLEDFLAWTMPEF